MTVPAHLAHIVYMTRRYAAMIDWYCTVFNAHPVHRDPALTFLAFDEENHRFAIANLDVMRPGGDGRQGDIGSTTPPSRMPAPAICWKPMRG